MILVIPVGVVCTGPILFPPVSGPYTGDYVYITEPGRYTLEHSLIHEYPVGVIISAPSVILDGQGYSIHPAKTGANPSIGIWISLTDSSGRPVTGVTIRNVSIEGEGYGIYAEGPDTSEFPWGVNRKEDPAVIAAVASVRSLTLSEIDVSSCSEGIVLQKSGVAVSDIRAVSNSGSGIVLNDSQAKITGSYFTGNNRYGIQIRDGSGTEISGSVISENGGAGVHLDQTKGIRIFDNTLNNNLNLEVGPDSGGIVLASDLHEGSNIVGGDIIGGNYWADDGASLAVKAGITDRNGDGIGDSPYEPIAGISDPAPLYKTGDIGPNGNQTMTTEPTLNSIPPVTEPSPVQTPLSILSGIHAVIMGDTIPSTMEKAKTYPVALYLSNDGSDDWIAQHQVGIMALEDAATYGPEWILVPVSGSVQSGKTITLGFEIRAPQKPGIYTLKYQAAREGSGLEVLFGRAYTKTVTVQ